MDTRHAHGRARAPNVIGSAQALLPWILAPLLITACGQTSPGWGRNQTPVALFSTSVTQGEAPLIVEFDASPSFDPDGTIVAYDWQFGDGAGGTGRSTSHVYGVAGAYTATLTITDERGASRSATATIEVGSGDAAGGTTAATVESTHQAIESALLQPGFLIASSVDAALEATRLNGGTATLIGTLTESGPQAFTYGADPNDLLRVVLLDGRHWDILFEAMPQGSFDGDGDRFLRNPHIIDLRVTSNAAAAALDLTVTSRPGQASHTQVGSLAGSFTDADGVRWEVDLAFEKFYRAEAELTGNELESIVAAAGSVASPGLGVGASIDRYYRYKLVNTAENIDHRLDHSFTHAGAEYRLAGRVFVGLNHSQPVDKDQWVIDGGLVAGGVVVGQLTATEDPSGLTVRLQLGSESIRLFFFGLF